MTQGLQVGVLVAQLAARVPGGTGRYTAELVRGLRDTRTGPGSPPHRLYVVAPPRCAPAAALGVPVRTLPVPALLLPRLWERGFPPYPARSGVLHAPTLLLPPARPAVRLVVTCHDVVPWTDPGTLTPRGVAFHRRMGERMAREADLVVTPTEAVAVRVRELLSPRAPVVAVLPGVSTLPAVGGPSVARARREALGVGGAPYVLFVGTAEPRKGLDVLVEAMAQPALRAHHLVVVGPPGWGDVDVAALAAAAGVGGRTHVTGRVDDADLAALYAGAAVLAMPSRAEGFGLPVVEAMAAGTAVVTSDDPALVEVGAGAALVTARGDAGALAQALARAAAPGGEREALVAAGRDRAAGLTWTAAARRLWGLYAGLAADA